MNSNYIELIELMCDFCKCPILIKDQPELDEICEHCPIEEKLKNLLSYRQNGENGE